MTFLKYYFENAIRGLIKSSFPSLWSITIIFAVFTGSRPPCFIKILHSTISKNKHLRPIGAVPFVLRQRKLY